MNTRPYVTLGSHQVPWILFRVTCHGEKQCDACRKWPSRPALINSPVAVAPRVRDFDNHLKWGKKPTRFTSFASTWPRVMRFRNFLAEKGHRDIRVIALWAKGLRHVYDAEYIASRLGYSSAGSYDQRKLQDHHDEYLIDGYVPDDHCVLAEFQGGGSPRRVVFESPFYKAEAWIPDDCFLGKDRNALEDLDREILWRTGMRDDLQRDLLVKQITNLSLPFRIRYKGRFAGEWC